MHAAVVRKVQADELKVDPSTFAIQIQVTRSHHSSTPSHSICQSTSSGNKNSWNVSSCSAARAKVWSTVRSGVWGYTAPSKRTSSVKLPASELTTFGSQSTIRAKLESRL